MSAGILTMISTTTDLTTTLSNKIADILGLSSAEHIVEYVVRGVSSPLPLGPILSLTHL